MLGAAHFTYPPNHIEADNRLSWFLGRLDRAYGQAAVYIHLQRNSHDTAASFVRRYSGGIIRAYRKTILIGLPRNSTALNVALDYCDTVASNIELFLRDKPRKMVFSLANARQDFRQFWELIQAEGDLEAALAEFDQHYNASWQPQSGWLLKFPVLSHAARKLLKILNKLRGQQSDS
ncbi:MAG: hypothetical protein HW386_1620 [Gammaproteobacteria bacterium]|nr:hypothetical protein [Gammaproteobacteria bacterium]